MHEVFHLCAQRGRIETHSIDSCTIGILGNGRRSLGLVGDCFLKAVAAGLAVRENHDDALALHAVHHIGVVLKDVVCHRHAVGQIGAAVGVHMADRPVQIVIDVVAVGVILVDLHQRVLIIRLTQFCDRRIVDQIIVIRIVIRAASINNIVAAVVVAAGGADRACFKCSTTCSINIKPAVG